MTAAAVVEPPQFSSAELVAELVTRAKTEGANVGLWPGLTFYRFTEPTQPGWHGAKPLSRTNSLSKTRPLSIGIIAQGSTAVAAVGQGDGYDTVNWLVIGSRPNVKDQILDASPRQPCLCLVLEVDPQLIYRLSGDMPGRDAPVHVLDDDSDECVVSALDDELMSSVLRFLRSLSVVSDRRVLAPLYLQEMVYRLLQRDQHARLVRVAAQQVTANPIAAALDYIAEHLADPLTVTELAKQVSLSPSAFSRLFRDVTGRSPYQFVKEERLNRARELLDEGRLGVTDVSRSVGYTSSSHFIKQFRGRFGATPGDYADTHTLSGRARAHRSNAVRPRSA